MTCWTAIEYLFHKWPWPSFKLRMFYSSPMTWLTAIECMCHKWSWIIQSFPHLWLLTGFVEWNMMGATSGAEIAHSSGAPESIPPLFFFLLRFEIAQSFFSVQFFVHHCLSFCPFFLGIVPSVLFIASDYHYGILNFFK
jgi:hypothetical protein